MAAYLTASTSRSYVLALPAELQVKVIKKLKFPDIHRLSATCKNFRNVIRQDIYSQALVDLEADWIDALASTPGKHCSGVDMRRSLRSRGYSDEDIDRTGVFAPWHLHGSRDTACHLTQTKARRSVRPP